MDTEIEDMLKAAYDKVPAKDDDPDTVLAPPEDVANGLPEIKTSVDPHIMKELNRELLQWPEGFNVFKKLGKSLSGEAWPSKEKVKLIGRMPRHLPLHPSLKMGRRSDSPGRILNGERLLSVIWFFMMRSRVKNISPS